MTEHEHDENAVWIKTEPTIDGDAYTVTVEFSQDRAITMTKGGAMRYCMTLLTAVAHAAYDAAVLAQLSEKVDENSAKRLILDLRKDRPPVGDQATRPLRFQPGVSEKGVGFLTLHLEGEPIGQWDLEPARKHALTLLETIVVADLDAAYARALVGIVGLERHTALAVVGDLAGYRQEEE